jgi:Na+-translocating ferredoxin:NAD+ oxidoreductase RnfG subunit
MKRQVARLVVASWLSLLLRAGQEEDIRLSVAWAAPSEIAEHPYEILEEYASVQEALQLLFPNAGRFEKENVRLTPGQAARVSALADHSLQEESFTVYKAVTDGAIDGYAVVTDEIGKFHFITFMVGVTPAGAVKRVEVLVYRESRGGEVRYRRFLHQYEGKSLHDPIRSNRDILNITGATLSVRAVSRGVRKVLGVIHEVYLAGDGSSDTH